MSFAVKALEKVGKQLPADRFFEAVTPALLTPVKGHAVRALKLTRRVLEREPELRRMRSRA